MPESRIEDLINEEVIASWRNAGIEKKDFYPKIVNSFLEFIKPECIEELTDEKIKELFFGAMNAIYSQMLLLGIAISSTDAETIKASPILLKDLTLHLKNLVILVNYMEKEFDEKSLRKALNIIESFIEEISPNTESQESEQESEQEIYISAKMDEWSSLKEKKGELTGELRIYERKFYNILDDLEKNGVVQRENLVNFRNNVTGAFLKIREIENSRKTGVIRTRRMAAGEYLESEVQFLIEYIEIIQKSLSLFSLNHLTSILRTMFLDDIDIE